MDFAKNLMKKYGWKEGEGLGKNCDGIDKPLRANYKFDNTGLGHDPAADFNNHWWERVYNDAANNIDVKNEAKVSVSTKSSDALEISTKEYSVNKLKKVTGENSYNNFLKTSTLSAVGESRNKNQVKIDDIGLTKYDVLTDDQLFAACGGRTAHKGARHGLKLSGKLARIEQQERELLAKMQNQSTTDVDPSICESASTSSSTKKKRKRKRDHQPDEEPEQPPVEQEVEDELADLLYNADYALTSKKKRKKALKVDKELSLCLEAFTLDKTNVDEDGDTVLEPPTNVTESKERDKKNRKRKRKNKQFTPEPEATAFARETPDELDDQLTVNSLEVNCSDSEQSGRQSTKKTKNKKTKKREKRLMKKLMSSLESSVVITD